MDNRIVGSRGLAQPGYESGFRKIKIDSIFVEIRLCSGLNTIRQIAVVDGIQVILHKLAFRVAPRHFAGDDDLRHFSTERAILRCAGVEHLCSRQLLCNCACAASTLTSASALQDCTGYSNDIKPWI